MEIRWYQGVKKISSLVCYPKWHCFSCDMFTGKLNNVQCLTQTPLHCYYAHVCATQQYHFGPRQRCWNEVLQAPARTPSFHNAFCSGLALAGLWLRLWRLIFSREFWLQLLDLSEIMGSVLRREAYATFGFCDAANTAGRTPKMWDQLEELLSWDLNFWFVGLSRRRPNPSSRTEAHGVVEGVVHFKVTGEVSKKHLRKENLEPFVLPKMALFLMWHVHWQAEQRSVFNSDSVSLLLRLCTIQCYIFELYVEQSNLQITI